MKELSFTFYTIIDAVKFVVLRSHNMKTERYIFITKLNFQRQQQSHLVQVQLLLPVVAYPRFHLSDTDYGILTLRTWASVGSTATLAFNKVTYVIFTSFFMVQRRNKGLCFLLHISVDLALVIARLTEYVTKTTKTRRSGQICM